MSSLLAGTQNEESAEAGGVVKGVAIGLVTKNKDDEGMGRVKVRFPWREDRGESYWARIAVPMAGNDRGTYFLPEVGDEVLLAFDRGDIRHPYVVGALWNGQDVPPATNADGRNDMRVIRTRSGHELRFDDNAMTGSVELKTTGGKHLYMDEKKVELSDGGGNSVSIDVMKGAITVASKTTVTIKSQKITLDAGAAMEIKAGGTLTVQGAMVKIN